MASRSRTRQQSQVPWIALLLALAFGLVTLRSEGTSAPLVEAAGSRLAEASSFFDEHPYLLAGPALRAHRSPASLERKRHEYEREREARGQRPVGAERIRREQGELDRMLAEASAALEELPARRYGVDPDEWRPHTLVTHVFVHSGVWHLVGNVLLLVLIGVYLEPALRPVRAILVLASAAVGSGLGYAFALPGLDHVMIGASGMLAGLLAVFVWDFWESHSEVFFTATAATGMVWLALPGWVGVPWSLAHPGVDLLGPLPGGHLAYWSYAGGAVAALSVHWVLGLLAGGPKGAAASHSARTSTGSSGLDDALKARADGRDEAAFQQLQVVMAKEPEQLDAALLMWDVARSLGKHDKAEAAMLRAIRLEIERGESAAAVRHWQEISGREIPREADPSLLLRVAALLRLDDHPRAASAALREALNRASGDNLAAVAGRVARAAQELDPQIAHDAAWLALNNSEPSIEERKSLEDLLAVVVPKLPGGEVIMSRAWEDEKPPEPIDVGKFARVLDMVSAVPTELDDEGLHIATRGGSKKRVLYERIEAIGVCAVQGLSQKPVLLVDLVLNWKHADEKLRLIRMRADRFDPRTLVPADSALESFRQLVTMLLERTDATPLPDRQAVLGNPFAAFDDQAVYERTVLMAESPLSENDA